MIEHTWDESNGDTDYQIDGKEDQLEYFSVEKFDSTFTKALTLLTGR